MIPSEQSQNFPMQLFNSAACKITLLAPDAVAVLVIVVICLGQAGMWDVGELQKDLCDGQTCQAMEPVVKSAPGG